MGPKSTKRDSREILLNTAAVRLGACHMCEYLLLDLRGDEEDNGRVVDPVFVVCLLKNASNWFPEKKVVEVHTSPAKTKSD